MTISAYLEAATSQLQAGGITTPRLDVLVLLTDELSCDKAWILAHGDALLNPTQIASLRAKVSRRSQHEPLSYIRGHQEFFGHRFMVNPTVLVPRPETELLVEQALKLPIETVLDVGTGSGAIAISVKLAKPDWRVFAVDLSVEALALARQNAQALGAQVDFAHSDLLTDTPVKHPDCIIANLPYVDRHWERSPETRFEPDLALFADDAGLALIKKLLLQAIETLYSGGYLMLEADPRQHNLIKQVAQDHGYKPKLITDYLLLFTR